MKSSGSSRTLHLVLIQPRYIRLPDLGVDFFLLVANDVSVPYHLQGLHSVSELKMFHVVLHVSKPILSLYCSR